jgi:hypothetical protein
VAAVAWVHDLKKHSTIVTRRRSEAPSFWRRNKDGLIVAAISATLGSALTLVATLFVGMD